MSAKRHIYELTIKEHHLDTFGHVNNAVYLQILEEARWELITQNGYGIDKVMSTKQGPTILEVNLKFMKELRLRQTIRIETYLQSYERKIGVLVQEIKNSAGDLCSIAEFKFGLFDVAQRKLVEPTPAWAAAIGMT